VNPALGWLAEMTGENFRQTFRGSPDDPDPLVAEHASWAMQQLRTPHQTKTPNKC